MAMDAIGFAAQMLATQVGTLAALVDAERQMHSYMHITDPTLYIKAMYDKGLKQQVRLAEAALAFVREVQTVKAECERSAAREAPIPEGADGVEARK